MKLLLVDGYSLLYRAFYSSPPFTTKAGEPTGALYGFIRMVINLLDEHKPEYAVVALDPHGPTFRHDADESYKAHRSETPSDLRVQQGQVRDMLEGFCIAWYEHQGFEADDVLGTLARRGAEHGLDVIIVTGDGDALQLAQEKVKVLLTRRGVSDLDGYGPQEVEQRFGFVPKLLPDFKGLKGDTSDNIPGVPGIGDKTGMSLIQRFGALEGVYEHLEEVTPVRIRELLRTHREMAMHSRHLATIVTNLPIEAQPESYRYEPLDPQKRAQCAQTARRFEFKSLVTRFETAEQLEAAPVDLPLKEPDFELVQLATPREALDWLEVRRPELVGLAWTEAGFFLAQGSEVLYFTGRPADLAPWLANSAAPKVMHDAKGFLTTLDRLGLALGGLQADTLISSYLLEPSRQQHPLPWMAEKYLQTKLPEPEAKGKLRTASLFAEDEAPSDEQLRILAARAWALPQLAPALRKEIGLPGQAPVLDELEMPLVSVLARIERNGMQLDPAPLRVLERSLEEEARQLETEIWELAGEKFNVGSTKQLQTVLYEKMGLEKGRSIKTGASTDNFTLEKLAEQNPIARKVLDFRGTTKLKSTYVDALLALMDPATHRIHTTLNQTGAVSGRLSSTDPNLQNIPIRTQQGRLIRKAFVAQPGHLLLSADYSQIELRILAHITGDAPLVEAFASGQDVHARTASALFGVPVEQVDKEMRRKAKMTNYAIAYGVSGFGLAKQLGSGTAGEATEFIKQYFETLPGVKAYMDDTLAFARKHGYVETLMGRRRPLAEINTPRFQERSAAERTAINHPIQGSAADVMKLAMLAVHRELSARELGTLMTMQVHDELVFEVPAGELEAAKELVRQLMVEVPGSRLGLRVTLEVDLGWGENWDVAKGSE